MKIEEKKKVRVGKVKKDKSGEDWIVPVYVDGKFNDDMTYYAGNGKEAKKDAEGTRDQIIKDMRNSKEYELEEEIMKEENIIELKDDVVIKQDDRKIILEKGDRVQVLKEARMYTISIDYDPAELNGDVSRRFVVRVKDTARQPSGMRIADITGEKANLIAWLVWHGYTTEDIEDMYPELL